jgi:hypothetical protein
MNDTGVVDVAADPAPDEPSRPGVLRRTVRWLGRPPRWWFHGACTVAALVLLWFGTAVGGDLVISLIALSALFLLACAWFVRAVAALLSRTASAWLLVAPVGGVVVAALLFVEAPLHLRWAMSQGEFERVAAEVRETEPGEYVELDRRLGALDVYGVRTFKNAPDALDFSVESGSFFDSTSIVHLPESDPDDISSSRFEGAERWVDLGDRWYAVVYSW